MQVEPSLVGGYVLLWRFCSKSAADRSSVAHQRVRDLDLTRLRHALTDCRNTDCPDGLTTGGDNCGPNRADPRNDIAIDDRLSILRSRRDASFRVPVRYWEGLAGLYRRDERCDTVEGGQSGKNGSRTRCPEAGDHQR